MALTEKSVELNLTSEMLNYLGNRYGKSFYALGPSMRAESRLGFDVSVRAPGKALLIQYKRAYVTSAGELEWRLNRTRQQDQHDKLQRLERSGLQVFYAFPRFSTALELSANRYRLLLETFWRRPLAINPSGGPRGFHEVLWNPVSGKWTVSSEDPVLIEEPPTDFPSVSAGAFERGNDFGYDDIARAVNQLIVGADLPQGREVLDDADEVPWDEFEGLSIIGWSESISQPRSV